MVTLKQIEEKYDFTFPEYFKRLWDDGMLNYMRGFEEGLKEGESWVDTVYPTLRENPPALLHSGEAQMTLLTPEAILNFQTPEFWDIETHKFIPFAKTLEGNYYAFYDNVKVKGEAPIVEIWDEMDDTEYYAKNFEDFIFRQMVESAEDIDKDDLKVEYDGDVHAYIADVERDIASITPYLKADYIKLLKDIYSREPKEGTLAYSLISMNESEEIVKEYLDFELFEKSFSHEI
ncbi:MAG: SMI1/KNR4 family protein [Sulfurimonas sp.]